MTGNKENFQPIHNNRINLFVCGPTVYDDSHIGHARTYIAFDVVARYLKYKGFSVFYLQKHHRRGRQDHPESCGDGR